MAQVGFETGFRFQMSFLSTVPLPLGVMLVQEMNVYCTYCVLFDQTSPKS